MPIKEKDQLSKNLIHFRKLHKMNQTQVATALGIPRERYAKYENNIKPPIEVLNNLAHLYNIKLDTLVKTVQYTPYKINSEYLKVSDIAPVDKSALSPEVLEILKQIDSLSPSSKKKLYDEIINRIENE